MARKLAAALALLCLTALGAARPSPKAPLCPGCDCLRSECYTPCCDCTEPLTQPWSEIMLRRVAERLVVRLGPRMRVAESLRVRLVAPQQLLADGDGVQGLYEDGRISLNSQLSRREAVAVLAHEYGHAWQFSHHPRIDEVDNSLREGFAEWVALQALKCFGEGSGGDVLRSNRDPVYGGGLRWFLQVEGNFGVEAVFQQATTWLDPRGTRLPEVSPGPKREEKDHDPSVPVDLPESGNGPDPR